jgi:hypothetical protein
MLAILAATLAAVAALNYTEVQPLLHVWDFGDQSGAILKTNATLNASDMSAAKHADVLFVKTKGEENDLATYCKREGIKHITIQNFGEALPIVQSVVKGEKSVSEVLG